MAQSQMRWKVLAISLTFLFAPWVPANAQSRCLNRERNSSEEMAMDVGDSHSVSMEVSRGRELPAGCTEEEEGEEEEFDSTVYLARFEFHRVETIFTVLVFIMVVVMAKMGEFDG